MESLLYAHTYKSAWPVSADNRYIPQLFFFYCNEEDFCLQDVVSVGKVTV